MTFVGPIRRVDTAKGHHYLDANGRRVPGVTSILSSGVPKPALINWAANVTAEYAVNRWPELSKLGPADQLNRLKKARFEDLDAAARRGTEVHALADKLIHGHEVDVPDALTGHVDAYIAFIDAFNVQPVLTETVVLSYKYGWAGTIDLIADFPTLGKRLLADVKTSRSGVYGETAWQLAGYRYADVYLAPDGSEKPMISVDGCAVIHVRSDGYSLVPITVGDRQLRDLRYIKQVAEACDKCRELIGDAVEPPKMAEV